MVVLWLIEFCFQIRNIVFSFFKIFTMQQYCSIFSQFVFHYKMIILLRCTLNSFIFSRY